MTHVQFEMAVLVTMMTDRMRQSVTHFKSGVSTPIIDWSCGKASSRKHKTSNERHQSWHEIQAVLVRDHQSTARARTPNRNRQFRHVLLERVNQLGKQSFTREFRRIQIIWPTQVGSIDGDDTRR
jgi:hypothetical protein